MSEKLNRISTNKRNIKQMSKFKLPMFLSCCSILALTTACVPELKVQEVYAPLTGDIIRSVIGPTDEGGGVRVSGIQTLSRRQQPQQPTVLASSLCNAGTSTTRTVKRRLCDGRVVTRQIRVGGHQPATYIPVVQSGYVVQDSQFFPGVGMAQTAVNAAIGAAGFAGGMYLGRPPASNFNVSQGDNTSSNYSTSAGSTATGGAGGNGKGGNATSTSTGGNANATSTSNSGATSNSNPVLHNVSNVNNQNYNTNANANANYNQNTNYNKNANTNLNTNDNRNSSKMLNNQSYQFHIQNPYHEKIVVTPPPDKKVVYKPHEKMVYKPHEDKKTYKHDDKSRYDDKKHEDKKHY